MNEICESSECLACICPEIWDLVCGVDGLTYANTCYARCAHVEVDFQVHVLNDS
ncbi:MAG: hypothetical protein GQ556_00485 [Desulfobacterales bacterium]|nr:hypothetical protein [Desulfobacterales bacterium]